MRCIQFQANQIQTGKDMTTRALTSLELSPNANLVFYRAMEKSFIVFSEGFDYAVTIQPYYDVCIRRDRDRSVIRLSRDETPREFFSFLESYNKAMASEKHITVNVHRLRLDKLCNALFKSAHNLGLEVFRES
mgnify:CR=1 FL=1